jgi:hypothetical protein
LAFATFLFCVVPLGSTPAAAVTTSAAAITEHADFLVTDWNELPGCLPRRFVVLGMVAKLERDSQTPELATH